MSWHPLLRHSVYSLLVRYEDTNDAVKPARDLAMQAVVGRRALEKRAASTNTLSQFQTEVLVTEENLILLLGQDVAICDSGLLFNPCRVAQCCRTEYARALALDPNSSAFSFEES